MDPTTAAIVGAAVAGVVAALKQLGLPTNLAPITALIAGIGLIALVMYVPDATKFLVGLSATGIYEILANTAKHSSNPEPPTVVSNTYVEVPKERLYSHWPNDT